MPVYAEAITRAVFGFVGLLILCRLTGQSFKVVSGVALGSLAAVVSLDPYIRLGPATAVFGVWLVLSMLCQLLALKVPAVRNFVQGTPSVLIRRGKVLEQNLKKARVTAQDMMSLLREKNVFKVADVEFAVMEPDGKVSVMLRSESQPTTPKTMNIPTQPEHAPYTVISDGQIIAQNLGNAGFSREWLWNEVRKQGARGFSDVYLAQTDSEGNLYVDLYDETQLNTPNRYPTRRLLLASMKQMQADLESYALQTANPEAKQMYGQAAERLQGVIASVAPELRRL